MSIVHAQVGPAPDVLPHGSHAGGARASHPGAVRLELFSSSFCGACRRTRQILDTVARLVPEVVVAEYNVADEPDIAEHQAVTTTPTVIIRDAGGAQTFRASGAPNINQVLEATARALDSAGR